VIRTLGRIELKQGGVDFAPMMLGKPVIAFIWLALLVRALTAPELEISRGSFADEFTPGMPVEKQLTRLRDRLDDMVHRDLPEELFSRLKVTRTHVRLDLSKAFQALKLRAWQYGPDVDWVYGLYSGANDDTIARWQTTSLADHSTGSARRDSARSSPARVTCPNSLDKIPEHANSAG
jgi:hypothetical protein